MRHGLPGSPAFPAPRLAAFVPILLTSLVLGLVVPAARAAVSETPASEAPPAKIATDPRVTDALAAWAVWTESKLAVDGVPGASVAVVYGPELLYTGGFGLADPDAGVAATPDTLYSICSISKLFTSIAAMQLRDAGKLELDEPIDHYLDWFDALTDDFPDDEPITLRRILTHSAGLPRESDSPYWSGPDFHFPSREQIRQRLASQHTLYPSGRYFQYSNLGLTLAGEVVAARSDRRWGVYVRDHILTPLGMRDTFTTVSGARATGRLAAGYSERRGGPQRERLGPFDAAGIGPAAGMVSSARDLARFAQWQLRLLADGGTAGGDTEVLRAATLREMQRVHWVDPDWDTTWGLGFSVAREGERTYVGHGGACPGYYTRFLLVPEEKMGVVVLSNAIGADVRMIADKAVKMVAPAIQKVVDAPEKVPDRDPALDRYVGVYDSVWGRLAIVRWKDGLAALDLQTRTPDEDLDELREVGEHTFRRVRKDDESLGETWTFQVDDQGRVTSVTAHSNPSIKVR